MRTRSAALGSAVFFVLAPGVVAGLVPWLLTGWRVNAGPWPLRAVGLVLLVAGAGFGLMRGGRLP
jgi:hypothetical protein